LIACPNTEHREVGFVGRQSPEANNEIDATCGVRAHDERSIADRLHKAIMLG